MDLTRSPLAWTAAPLVRAPGPQPSTWTALYSLNDLISRQRIDVPEARALLGNRGLRDAVWQVTWAEDSPTPEAELPGRLRDADGYVLFIHGWTGNHSIWEELPGLVVRANRRLVALSLDHNGFGGTRFSDETPALSTCCPPSAMAAIQQWVDLLRLRRQPGELVSPVIHFVGHSMGGAALFYLNPLLWEAGEETRYAVAPALLLNDSVHRAFFSALGLGIRIVDLLRIFEPIEDLIQPGMVNAVCEGSSQFVRDTHNRLYDETPRGITASTFRAMGLLSNWEIAHRWSLFRVMLGHKDTLVGLTPMMDLLSDLEVPPANIRVVAGSHYMFSVGPDTVFQHAQNRDLIAQDILDLHERAVDMRRFSRASRRFG